MANLARKSKDAYVRQYEGYLDDLNTLKAELRNLLAPTSVASRRPALLKVKAILARGNAFRLLDEEFLRPDLPWEMDGFQVDVLMQAMSAYSLYIEVSSLPEYSSLRATKPMALAAARRSTPMRIAVACVPSQTRWTQHPRFPKSRRRGNVETLIMLIPSIAILQSRGGHRLQLENRWEKPQQRRLYVLHAFICRIHPEWSNGYMLL